MQSSTAVSTQHNQQHTRIQAITQHKSSTVNRLSTSSMDQFKAALWSTWNDTVREFTTWQLARIFTMKTNTDTQTDAYTHRCRDNSRTTHIKTNHIRSIKSLYHCRSRIFLPVTWLIKTEAFEMWIWKRMEKISWRDKITNVDVLKRVNEERSLLKEIWQRKHRWIGHVLRHDGFLVGIFEGRMLGKRTRGRRRMQMLHDLTGNSDYVTLKQTAAERTIWRYSTGISWTCSTAEDWRKAY